MNKKMLAGVLAAGAVVVLAGCGKTPETPAVEETTVVETPAVTDMAVVEETLPTTTGEMLDATAPEFTQLEPGAMVIIEQPADVVETIDPATVDTTVADTTTVSQ